MLKKELKLFQVKLINYAHNQSIPRLLFKNLFESLVKMFVQNVCLFEMFLQDICWKRLFDTCLLKNKSLEKSLEQIFLARIF